MSIFRKKIKKAVDGGLNKAHDAMQPKDEEGAEPKQKGLLASLPAPIFGKVARMAIVVIVLAILAAFTAKMLKDARALSLLLLPLYFVLQIIYVLISYKKGKYNEYEGECLEVKKNLVPGSSERARKVSFEITDKDGTVTQRQFRAVMRKDEFSPGLLYRLFTREDDDSVLFAWEIIGKKPGSEPADET